MFRSLTVFPVPFVLASMARLRPLRILVLQRASTVLSATGALCGMTGTALLSAHPGQTTAVFALYSGSAAAWMTVGMLTRQRWLLAANVAYLMLALKGLMF